MTFHHLLNWLTIAFSALTLFVGHQEKIWPVKKLNDDMLAWFYLERSANDLHMIQLMPLSPSHLLLH